jgi:hypothetical protein
MAHSWHHAESSARKFGGDAQDYIAVHTWFDATKSHLALPRHRALRHHTLVLSQSLATHQKSRILFSARHIWTSSLRKFSLVWPKFWIIWHSRGLNVGLRRTKFFKKKLCDSTHLEARLIWSHTTPASAQNERHAQPAKAPIFEVYALSGCATISAQGDISTLRNR